MNTEWQQFLKGIGAKFEGNDLTGFDQLTGGGASTGDTDSKTLFDISSLGILEVSGSDSELFLQGHLVNDLSMIGTDTVQLSGYCSTKGRLLATFFIIANDKADGYWLLMPTDVLSTVLQRLEPLSRMPKPVTGNQMIGKVTKMDVNLKNHSAELMVFGVSDRQVLDSALDSMNSYDPEESSSVIRLPSLTAFRLPHSERYLCFGSIEVCRKIWEHEKDHAALMTEEQWNLANVRSGLPQVLLDTQDKVIPQMANLHLLDGLSFTKGCYPGQEIVARMQYLGKLKRHMARFEHAGPPLPVGSSVISGNDQDAGWVMTSASAGVDRSESLIIVKIAAKESGFEVNDSTGSSIVPLTELPLPYALISDETNSEDATDQPQ